MSKPNRGYGIVPPLDKIEPTKRHEARGRVRPNAKVHVKMADQGQVRSVLKRVMEKGRTFPQACNDAGVSQAAWWRRVRADRELGQEVAAALISQIWGRTDAASAGGNAAALAIFAKFGSFERSSSSSMSAAIMVSSM